jgi:hypothetical protein
MATYVFYHLPSDKDDPDHPNAYQINKPADDITLQDVRDNFPLPGKYHFRFKVRLGDSNNSFWLDVNDETKIVPAFGPRRIIVKALRLSWEDSSRSKKTSPVPSVVNTKVTGHSVADSVDLFSATKPQLHSNATHAGKSNLVGDLDLFG